jgi:ceramide glucosyltransferase
MTLTATLLFSIACIGTISSTVFLFLAIFGARKFHRQAAEQVATASRIPDEQLPPVSLLKPLHGWEPQLDENIESFFQQDYPNFEILLAVDTEDDAALPIARALCAKYPHVPAKVMVTGEPLWPNPPAFCFSRMEKVAAHDILVTSDSDVIVDRDYLRTIVPPLMEKNTGMLTCVYRGLNTGGFWSEMDSIGMSVEMTAGVVIANMLEGMKFGLGPTIVVRRDALKAIGGYASLGDYFSNDFVIGNMVADAGYTVVLSRHIISHVVPPMSFRKMWQRQVRWAAGTRRSRPQGHFGTGLVFAVPYGLLGFVSGLFLHHPRVGVAMLAWSVVNRMIESLVIGWGITRDRRCLTQPWLYPVRDLLGFAVWVASYLNSNMRWRDGRFELVRGGKILQRDRDGKVVHMNAAL